MRGAQFPYRSLTLISLPHAPRESPATACGVNFYLERDEMNDITTESHETGTEPGSGADRASLGTATRSSSNWAWATPTSQYDWMDGHAPFASLDQPSIG